MRRPYRSLLLSAASLCTLALVAPLPAATDVQVNSDLPGDIQNEVSLTLNPATSGNVVVAYNDFPASGNGIGVSFSSDFGGSWMDRTLSVPSHPIAMPPNPPTPDDGMLLQNIFDPTAGADTLGRVYAGYIATDSSGTGRPSGLYVEHSDDGGNMWSGTTLGPTNVSFSTRSTSTVPGSDPTYRFEDKPHLTVDRSATSAFTDNVYVTWIQDVNVNQPTSDILFARSIDRGLTFSTPMKISDAPSGGASGGKGNGPNAAVAPDGTVYVAWLDVDVTNPSAKSGTLMFDSSSDGGVTFAGSGDVSVKTIRSVANNLSTTLGSGDDARARSYPAIAVNPGNSQEVYMVYAEDPDFLPGPDGLDEADIFLLRSADGGATWPHSVRVNDDSTTTDQFEPWIAVKPNGTIDVVWYDKRNDPTNDAMWDVYLATSTDGGTSFLPNVRVSDTSFAAANPNSPGAPGPGFPWIGEYLGLAVDSNFAYIGFTSTVNDANFGDIFFDRIPNPTVTAIPEPATLLMVLLGLLAGGVVRRRGACGRCDR